MGYREHIHPGQHCSFIYRHSIVIYVIYFILLFFMILSPMLYREHIPQWGIENTFSLTSNAASFAVIRCGVLLPVCVCLCVCVCVCVCARARARVFAVMHCGVIQPVCVCVCVRARAFAKNKNKKNKKQVPGRAVPRR